LAGKHLDGRTLSFDLAEGFFFIVSFGPLLAAPQDSRPQEAGEALDCPEASSFYPQFFPTRPKDNSWRNDWRIPSVFGA
jgi:hypothetical protein